MTYRFLIGLGVLNLLAVITLSYFLFRKDSQFAYVDSVKLLNEYQGMINARAEFKAKSATWQANIDTLGREVQQQIFQYEKSSQSMSLQEKELSKKLIQVKQKQLQDYQQAIRAQAEQEDAKATEQVVKEVNVYLSRYGERKGFTIIFAATEVGNIVYGNKAVDLTDDVLQGLNAEYSGK